MKLGPLCLRSLDPFFRITRPGEVLRAFRSDLVLPSDLMSNEDPPAFLQVRSPKPRRRGKGRIQHATVHQPLVIDLVECFYRDFSRRELLYGVAPSSFRRRWDAILLRLGLGRRAKLANPGGLRAGGAVFEYRRGIDLRRPMWRMRLRLKVTKHS